MDEPIRILVVQSDESERHLLYQYLRSRFNVQFSEAENCQEAIALWNQADSFDCIVIDYQLPDVDVLSLVGQIRDTGSNIPLIVLIPQEDEESAVKLRKAGASDYLVKGQISPDNLASTLNHALHINQSQQQAQTAYQLLTESEERYRLVLAGSYHGIWDWDLPGRKIYGNERLWQMLGLPPVETTLNYQILFRLLHPHDRLKIKQMLSPQENQLSDLELTFRLRHLRGEYRHFMARGTIIYNYQSLPVRISGILNDITESKRREERAHFLAQANTLLSGTVDYRTTLANVAWLAVSRIADWCAIDVLTTDGSYQRLSVAHVNPNQEELVWQLQLRYPETVSGNFPLKAIWDTNCLEKNKEICESFQTRLVPSPQQLTILKELKICSYILVPIAIGQRLFGSMLLAYSDSGRNYTQEDVNLAEDLARRAAWALENAKLYREVQEANENLSKAILILGEQQQQLRILQELTNLLNQRLTDLPDLLKVMAGSVCQAISGAQICFITLFNQQCDRLVLTVMAGEGKENLQLETSFPSKQDWLPQVFLTGESQLIQASPTQLAQESGSPAAIYAVAIESVQSGRLGVMAVGNWESIEAFSEENRALLTAVGEQAAIAIDNARLIKTLESREEHLELQYQMLTQTNEALEEQRQEIHLKNLQLIEAAKLKSQFIATMSHELRTPMNAIIGFSQLLLRQRSFSLVPKQEEMVERILNNGQHLLQLINDILDLSKIDAERLELKPGNFDLITLVEATIEELRSLAQQKHLILEFHRQIASFPIFNDCSRLRQILVNLISNAIKFTETGGIKVRVQAINEDKVTIEVEDTGIGIAQDQLQHIFDEFWQVDQSITRKYGGTGLGLAITESLVVLMQGKISVESRLGFGSNFRVELPRHVATLKKPHKQD